LDITFYDKKTCGTCKKAKAFLEDHEVKFNVMDILSDPPSRELLEKLIPADNVKPYLNSRSAIYRERKLGQNLPDKTTAIALMMEDPNLIKRPLIISGQQYTFGFQEQEFLEKWI